MRDIEKTRLILTVIKDRFEEEGVPWAVFAGAAAYCYGARREITDVDILVRCEDLDKAKVAVREVDTEGFDLGGGAEIPTPQGTCRFFLDDEMIKRIRWKQLFGIIVPVMSPEDNIVLKAILQRGNEEGKHDVQDIKDMVKNQKIDQQYLQRRIEQCHSQKRVKLILQSIIYAN